MVENTAEDEFPSCCVCVCECVCECVHLTSGAECLFVLKTQSCTQHATRVKKFSLKLLCLRVKVLPPLHGYDADGHFLTAEYVHVLLGFHLELGAGSGQ